MEGLGVVVGKLVVIPLGVAVELVHGSDVLRAEQLRIQLCRSRNGLACNGGVVFELLDELEMLNERVAGSKAILLVRRADSARVSSSWKK